MGPTLLLTAPGNQDRVVLVSALDAIRMSRQADGQAEPVFRAIERVETFARPRMVELRDFVGRAGFSDFPLSRVDDPTLLALVNARLRRGDLVALRETTAGQVDQRHLKLRRLVAEIESKVRRLSVGGREYRLVLDVQLARLADRNSYEVVSQKEAIPVLESVAQQGGIAGTAQANQLREAALVLTKDWRPPLNPDGLVLLRRVAQRWSAPGGETPISPSTLRKIRDEGWIEIAFVDAGGEPVADVDFELRLADGQTQSGKTNPNGSARFEGITPGECLVQFPNVDGPVVAV